MELLVCPFLDQIVDPREILVEIMIAIHIHQKAPHPFDGEI
jgi:hypothetical protein